MYKLFYNPGACSMAIHVLLNELGQQVTLVRGHDDNYKPTAELLKVNPRGSVPVLVDGDVVVREGAAIILYLLEKHPNALLPKSGKERALALEWLMSANATLHPAYGKAFGALKGFTGETQEKVLAPAVEQINKLWKEIDERLAHSPYLGGKEVTAADILVTVIANWSPRVSNKIVLGENTKRMLRSVVARPSYQTALATEQVEYKAAA